MPGWAPYPMGSLGRRALGTSINVYRITESSFISLGFFGSHPLASNHNHLLHTFGFAAPFPPPHLDQDPALCSKHRQATCTRQDLPATSCSFRKLISTCTAVCSALKVTGSSCMLG